MKKILVAAFALLLSGQASFSQTSLYPAAFEYTKYVTPARDQLVQSPCFVHAIMAGIETMYNLYYGADDKFNLSERALFSCCRNGNTYYQALWPFIDYVKQNGAIFESCKEYPKRVVSPCDENKNMALKSIIFDVTLDGQTCQNDCGTRFKVGTQKLTINELDRELVKKYLLSYGPIIFSNSDHAMLLTGWDAQNWVVKDSWPCDSNKALKVPFLSPYRYSSGHPYVCFSEAYVVKSITKEVYNRTTNVWSVATAPAKIYSNLNFLKIAVKGSTCFNRGIYEVNGLNYLTGVKVKEWSYTASNDYINTVSIIMSADSTACTVSGNAAGVTLYATIRRSTGFMEKISLPIGNLGVPAKVTTLNGHCDGQKYVITSQIVPGVISGCTYSYQYNIPASTDYTVTTSGPYAYWTFTKPVGLRYTYTVTATKNTCTLISNTQTAYIYAAYCGTSYKAIDSTNVIDIDKANLEENSPLVSPNPAKHELTLGHVGKGVNDIKIYNLSGTLVYSVSTEKTVTIDVGMLPRGVYIVRYNNSEKQQKPIKIVLE